MKLLALYLLLEPCEVVFANMQGMLPATLPDIESEMYALLFQKKTVSSSKLSNPQFMLIVGSGELGDFVGGGGRLRCLHGKVDTTISCMCTCSVGSAQCSGCVVYGPGAMAAIWVLLLLLLVGSVPSY